MDPLYVFARATATCSVRPAAPAAALPLDLADVVEGSREVPDLLTVCGALERKRVVALSFYRPTLATSERKSPAITGDPDLEYAAKEEQEIVAE